jgi:hypothetical protein
MDGSVPSIFTDPGAIFMHRPPAIADNSRIFCAETATQKTRDRFPGAGSMLS